METESLIESLSVEKINPDGTLVSANKQLSIDLIKGTIETSQGSSSLKIGGNNTFSLTDTEGNLLLDENGLVSTSAFSSDSIVSIADTRTTSSTSFVEVPNTTIDISIAGKEVNVLFFLYGDFANYAADGGIASEYVGLDIDGKLYPDALNGFGNVFYYADVAGDDLSVTLATFHGHYLATLGSGKHTAMLKYRKQGVATVDARVTNTGLSYIILGK